MDNESLKIDIFNFSERKFRVRSAVYDGNLNLSSDVYYKPIPPFVEILKTVEPSLKISRVYESDDFKNIITSCWHQFEKIISEYLAATSDNHGSICFIIYESGTDYHHLHNLSESVSLFSRYAQCIVLKNEEHIETAAFKIFDLNKLNIHPRNFRGPFIQNGKLNNLKIAFIFGNYSFYPNYIQILKEFLAELTGIILPENRIILFTDTNNDFTEFTPLPLTTENLTSTFADENVKLSYMFLHNPPLNKADKHDSKLLEQIESAFPLNPFNKYLAPVAVDNDTPTRINFATLAKIKKRETPFISEIYSCFSQSDEFSLMKTYNTENHSIADILTDFNGIITGYMSGLIPYPLIDRLISRFKQYIHYKSLENPR